MITDPKKPQRFGLRRLLRIFGITTPSELPSQDKAIDIQVATYTAKELRHVGGFSTDGRDSEVAQYHSTDAVLSQLNSTVAANQNIMKELSTLNLLSPEIPLAREIMVGSIMSPTDLQTDGINIVVQNTDLGSDLEETISAICNDYFNNDLHLGEKVSKWIGDALFETGATAILVMPQHNIDLLNSELDKKVNKYGGKVKESTEAQQFPISLETLADASPLWDNQLNPSSKNKSKSSNENLIDISTEIIDETVVSLEALSEFSKTKPGELTKQVTSIATEIKTLMKANASSILVSSDVRVINSSESRLTKKMKAMEETTTKNFLFSNDNPTMILSDLVTDTAAGNAALIEIPANAIVPIAIPGSPHKHLGYAILVNQWGAPLSEVNNNDSAGWNNSGSKPMADSSLRAAFGRSNLSNLSGNVSESQQYQIASKLFGLTVKNMMESKLEKQYGLDGISLGDHEALTNCIFRQLLLKNKVGLIFVPEKLLVYYAFDHRPDGTGKSIVEDMRTLLSLRTTLLVSYVMAATENSIDHKTLEVAVDDKQVNLEQYLDMINQTFIDKKILRFNNNPQAVMRDLTQKALTIIPRGIRGLPESLNVTTERRNSGAISPDTELLGKLTEWIVSFLQVPAAAMNQLGQNEFSRSIATTNLFFNNNIKSKQRIVNAHSTKLVRLVLMYSTALREKVMEKLKSVSTTEDTIDKQSTKEKRKKSEKETPVSGEVVVTNSASVQKNLIKIIQNLQTSLPKPKIVVDKAQHTELSEILDAQDKLVERLYPDDLLGPNGSEFADLLKLVRATVKTEMLRNHIENIGYQSTYNIPYPSEVNIIGTNDLTLRMANMKKRFDDIKAQLLDVLNSGKPEPSDDNENDDSGNTQDANAEGPSDDNSEAEPEASAVTKPEQSSSIW